MHTLVHTELSLVKYDHDLTYDKSHIMLKPDDKLQCYYNINKLLLKSEKKTGAKFGDESAR